MKTFPVITIIVCLAGLQINGQHVQPEKGDLSTAASRYPSQNYGYGGNSNYGGGGYGGYGKGQGYGSSNYGSGMNYNGGYGYGNGRGGSGYNGIFTNRGGKGKKYGVNNGYGSGYGQGFNDFDLLGSPHQGYGHSNQGYGHSKGYGSRYINDNDMLASTHQAYGYGHRHGGYGLVGSTNEIDSDDDPEEQNSGCGAGCVGSTQNDNFPGPVNDCGGVACGANNVGSPHGMNQLSHGEHFKHSGGRPEHRSAQSDKSDESDESDESDDVGAPQPVPNENPSDARSHGHAPAYTYSYPSPPPHVKCGQNLLISCTPSSQVVPCSAHSPPTHGSPY